MKRFTVNLDDPGWSVERKFPDHPRSVHWQNSATPTKFKKIVLNYTFLGSLSVCCFSWRKDSQLPLSVMFTEMSSANCPPDNSWILSPSFSWLIGGHPGRTRIHTQSEWEMFPFHLIMSYSLYLPAKRYLTNDFLKWIKLEL